MDYSDIFDSPAIEFLSYHSNSIKDNTNLNGYSPGRIVCPSLGLEYPTLPNQFIRSDISSGEPRYLDSCGPGTGAISGIMDHHCGAMFIDLYIPEKGDDLDNIMLSAFLESYALMALGRLTELNEYLAQSEVRISVLGKEVSQAWDNIMIRGAYGLAVLSSNDCDQEADQIREYVNLMSAYLNGKNKEHPEKDPKILMAYSSMLLASVSNEYSVEDFAKRLVENPFDHDEFDGIVPSSN